MRRLVAGIVSVAASVAFLVLPARPASAALADVGITVASNPTAVPVGGVVTYHLTVKNLGSLPTVSINVSDSQSAGTVTATSAGCSHTANTASCTAGSLSPGSSISFDVVVTAPTTGGTITNAASVSALFLPTALDGNQSNNSASANTLVTVGDLKAGAQSIPAGVSTGQDVIYRLTATNVGGIPTSSVTFNSSQNGGTFASNAHTAGCTYPTATTATCVLGGLAPGASESVDVVVTAPATTGPITNTVTVSGVFSPATTDANPADNSASVTTPVADPTPGSVGYIPPTGSMTYLLNTLTVPATGTRGIIANMTTATVASGTMCGTAACNTTNGLHVGIVQDPNYQVTDTNKPLITDVSFGQGDPCRGLGNACTALYWRHDATTSPSLIQSCLVAGHAVPAPCLDHKYKMNGGDIHYVVLGLSTDPDYLAPLRTLL
jgi:uncharacterized repeat protein (TIGR01451 family)